MVICFVSGTASAGGGGWSKNVIVRQKGYLEKIKHRYLHDITKTPTNQPSPDELFVTVERGQRWGDKEGDQVLINPNGKPFEVAGDNLKLSAFIEIKPGDKLMAQFTNHNIDKEMSSIVYFSLIGG